MRVRAIGLAAGSQLMLDSELAAAAAAACAELGIEARYVRTSSDARDIDLLIGIGYPQSYPVLFDPSISATRVAWMGEPLPPARESGADAAFRRLPLGRILDATIATTSLGRRIEPWDRLSSWRERAAYAYEWRHNLRGHLAAERAGIRIVVTSRDRFDSLLRRGLRAPVVPFGYHPVMAGAPADPAECARDIDVLFLGTEASDVRTRRSRLVPGVIDRLDPGTRVTVVERGLWGTQRSTMLRRAKIVLNIHRVPGNFEGIRCLLAGAAGTLVISEPVADPYPLVPGVHYVEVLTKDLAASVDTHLQDDSRRVRIARSAQAFVVEQMTMRRSIEMLIEAVA